MSRYSLLLVAASAGVLALCPVLVRADEPAPTTAVVTPPAPEKTGKERLSDKASDEQRVDNCRVPPERRGTKPRPNGCPRVDEQVPTN
jgi:hypothetical protein